MKGSQTLIHTKAEGDRPALDSDDTPPPSHGEIAAPTGGDKEVPGDLPHLWDRRDRQWMGPDESSELADRRQ